MRIENRVWVAIVVILFAGIPFIPVDLSTIKRHARAMPSASLRSPPTRAGRTPTPRSTTRARWCRWWFFRARHLEGGDGGAVAAIPAERARVRCAWTWMPRASMTRCWPRGRRLVR